jgi:NAD(P)-dependent dehydrogenase (short-subunit alcohol dehydrogenase family)
MDKNAVTIVTGGGRGIGRAIAIRMAKETAVLVVGRTQADLQSVCSEIRAAGGEADFIVGDVSDPATAQQAVQKAAEKGWTVRNLVCNAAIAKGGPSVGFDQKLWRNMYEVNVLGTSWFVQACAPLMQKEKRGALCVISSTAGMKGYKYMAAYCGTKAALIGQARSWALEYARDGIVVASICPGCVDTEMTTRTICGVMKRNNVSLEEATRRVAALNPQQRILPQSEVAEAVAMVCSQSIPSLNGAALVLGGGEV